ncbi:MAG: hypothetical protein AB1704_20410 [Pseudomonadota bacterium]
MKKLTPDTDRIGEMHVAELVRDRNAKIGRELLCLVAAAVITIGASFGLGRLPGLGYPLMIVGFTCVGWFARGVYHAQHIDTRFYPPNKKQS